MKTVLKSLPSVQLAEVRRIENFKRWLSGDPTVNLAMEMYTGDHADQSERHAKGHSSSLYYVKRDEDDTLLEVKRGIKGNYQNFIDLGVGGSKAVERALDLASAVNAESYFGCDLSPVLVNGAARLAQRKGFNAAAFVCDIFEPLPFQMRNSLIGILGLTIQNQETFSNPSLLRRHIVGIYKNYSKALTSTRSSNPSNGGFLVGWDANMNSDEVKNCYDNPELAGLVRGVFDGIIAVDKFDYHVATRNIKMGNHEEIGEVALGLKSRVGQFIEYEGERFPISAGTFLPVINSNRFNVPMQLHMLEEAGFKTPSDQRWTATGRIHYQHARIG